MLEMLETRMSAEKSCSLREAMCYLQQGFRGRTVETRIMQPDADYTAVGLGVGLVGF